MQRPAVASVPIGRIDDRLNVGMPALEVHLEPFPGKFGGPRFLGHFIRLDEPNEIKQSASAQVVVTPAM